MIQALVLVLGIANPVQLTLTAQTNGTATCHASDGSLGTWVRATGIKTTDEPSVLDAEVGAQTWPDAMLYCHDGQGRPGKIEAKPASLIYPRGTIIEPLYRLTIDHPAADKQDPYQTPLGPDGVITKAAFGQVVIFNKHSMLIVPSGWKIESKAAAILPKRPGAYESDLDDGSCEVNRMDDEDEFPRYIGTADGDCSVKIDLNSLQ